MITNKIVKTDMQRRILGVWNLRGDRLSLGCLLIFLEELRIQQLIHKAEYIDLCFIGDGSKILSGNEVCGKDGLLRVLGKECCNKSIIITTLLDIDNINLYYQCDSFRILQNFISDASCEYILWPSANEQEILNYNCDNTFTVQKFFQNYSFIPYLSCRIGLLDWAINFLQSNVFPSIPVVIHLKNNPEEQNCSNANFDAWIAFFETCNVRYNAKFILIGNEKIDKRIHNIPNVLLARDFGSNLSRDLALIQTACIFMGMTSGPCQMALFSDVPYIIYKNPDHHAEKMHLELGREDRYSFATSLQKVLRAIETQENILSNFDFLYNNVNEHYWETKQEKLQLHKNEYGKKTF